jgi:hypothetical protein
VLPMRNSPPSSLIMPRGVLAHPGACMAQKHHHDVREHAPEMAQRPRQHPRGESLGRRAAKRLSRA